MRRWLPIYLCLLLPWVMVACEDDEDDAFPPVRMEFVEVITNSKSEVDYILTDDGQRLAPSSTITAARPDTTYRCVCQYAVENKACHVYDLRTIYAKKPVRLTASDTLWTDPIGVNSVWKGPRYVNLSLALLTTGRGSHSYSFVEDTVMTNGGDVTTVHCTVTHRRQGDDPESYTQNVYLSMPVYDYLEKGVDSVAVTINTYSGPKTYRYQL